MMAMPQPNIRAIKIYFWVAAIGFWGLGIVWAANSGQPLWLKLLVSGTTGAIAAMALTWVLSHMTDQGDKPDSPPKLGPAAEGPRPGKGGSGTIIGDRGKIYGGRGGSGIGGGDGGGGFVQGNDGMVVGGDAGNGPWQDAEGKWYPGSNARPTIERLRELGLSTPGVEAAHVLTNLLAEYAHSYGGGKAPDEWINQRLAQMNLRWRVKREPTGGGIRLLNVD